jgi:hypothetical protein
MNSRDNDQSMKQCWEEKQDSRVIRGREESGFFSASSGVPQEEV